MTCGSNQIPPLKLAEAFIRDQKYENVMCPQEGFLYGTIFKDLVRYSKGHGKGYCREEEEDYDGE